MNDIFLHPVSLCTILRYYSFIVHCNLMHFNPVGIIFPRPADHMWHLNI